MKRFLLLLVLLIIPFSVKGIVKPTNNFYVNDYANILSPETEQYIMDKSLEINKIDGTQIVVLTVTNLDGMSIEDYAYKYINDNGIGDKDKNNGLLIMVALKERLSRIEVGNGLEGILPDGKTGRFQDQYMIPYFKNDNFDEGIKNGYNAFFKEIVELNHLDLEYDKPVYKNPGVHESEKEERFPIEEFSCAILGFLIASFFMSRLGNIGIIVNIVMTMIVLAINVSLYTGFFALGVIVRIMLAFDSYLGGNGYGHSGGGGHSSGGSSSYSGGGGHSSGGGSTRGF